MKLCPWHQNCSTASLLKSMRSTLMLSLNGFCGNWSWRSFIGKLDVMNAILYFAVCLSQYISLAQTHKTSSSSISHLFASTRLCVIKRFWDKTRYCWLLYHLLVIKVQGWGCLRPKMEAITISPLTHDGILLFACTFCYGHVKFSLYQTFGREN